MAGWAIPLTCTPSGDPSRDRLRCADSGWSLDVGTDFRLRAAARALAPYVGVGAGALRSGKTSFAINTRAGIDVPARARASLRLEGRYLRAFDAYYRHTALGSAGVRLRF